jgi:hypothetical protein
VQKRMKLHKMVWKDSSKVLNTKPLKQGRPTLTPLPRSYQRNGSVAVAGFVATTAENTGYSELKSDIVEGVVQL